MSVSRITSFIGPVIWLLLIFFSLPKVVYSQPFFEVFSISHVRTSGDMKINSEIYREYFNNIKFNYPVAIDSNYLLLSGAHDHNVFHYGAAEQELNMSRLSLGWIQHLGNSWSATVVFIPRVATGNDRWLDDQNMQYGFAVLARKKYSATFRYWFGVYYNNEFFGPFIVPLAGFYWKLNSDLALYGTLPNSLSIDKGISEKIHAGFNFFSNTNSYRLSGKNFLKVEENQVNFFLTYYLKKIHALTLEAGRSVLRENYFGKRVNGETTYSENQVKDGWLVRLNYSIRISTSD